MATPSHAHVLKNPGAETGKVLDFPDGYPDPREFLRNGGFPGVSYLYVLSANIPKAQSFGWESINNMPHFVVKGMSMTIMAKGRPSLMGSSGAVKPIFFLDDDAKKKLGGLNLDGTNMKPEPLPQPKPAPQQPQPSHNQPRR